MNNLEVINKDLLKRRDVTPHVALVDGCLLYDETGGVAVMEDTNFSIRRKYVFDKEIKNREITFGDGSVIVFDGGKLSGCNVKGKGLRVENANFENCTFFDATFKNCKVKASQFGFVADMHNGESVEMEIKGVTMGVVGRCGTVNNIAANSLSQFASGGMNIDIEFDGSFFFDTEREYLDITINDARRISVHGGVIVGGLRFVNCTDIDVYEMEFVGSHKAHDFPPLRYNQDIGSTPIIYNSVKYDNSNTYNIVKDGAGLCGISSFAIWVRTENGFITRGVNIHNCKFEMRQGGISLGVKQGNVSNYETAGYIENVAIGGCTFDHIYFQPISMHAGNVVIHDCRGEYMMQPVDISTMSHNVKVHHCYFSDSWLGPKQESFSDNTGDAHKYTYGNSIEKCSFLMSDKLFLVDVEPYIINIAKGAKGSDFISDGCYFEIGGKSCSLSLIRCCTYFNIFKNCDIIVNTTKRDEEDKNYPFMYLLRANGNASSDGSTIKTTIEGCRIDINNGYYFCGDISTSRMNMEIINTNISGTFSYSFASPINSLTIDGCVLRINSYKLTEGSKNIILNNSDFSNGILNSLILPVVGVTTGYNIKINKCTFSDTLSRLVNSDVDSVVVSDCTTNNGRKYNDKGELI